MGEGWNIKTVPKWSPAATAIEARAREARIFLRDLARDAHAANATAGRDVHIVVTTHGGFLHYFTEDWNGHEKFLGTGWANTEYRSYEFVEGSAGASLQETDESRKNRDVKPLSEAEQRNLRKSAEADWSASGYQTPKDQEPQEPLQEPIEVKT